MLQFVVYSQSLASCGPRTVVPRLSGSMLRGQRQDAATLALRYLEIYYRQFVTNVCLSSCKLSRCATYSICGASTPAVHRCCMPLTDRTPAIGANLIWLHAILFITMVLVCAREIKSERMMAFSAVDHTRGLWLLHSHRTLHNKTVYGMSCKIAIQHNRVFIPARHNL